MKKLKRKYKILIVILIALIPICIIALSQKLIVRNYTIKSVKVSSEVKAAVITDLHSVFYGDNQSQLIAAIDEQQPDVIFLVGDIADDVRSHDGTIALLEVIGRKHPCYYVIGNHEIWSGEHEVIAEMIRSFGVTVLEGEHVTAEFNGQKISISGIDDPDKFNYLDSWLEQINHCSLQIPDNTFSILLSHRPEKVKYYNRYDYDLILTGHAHGGQWRLPGLINGLYVPNQGLFPKYAGGRYELETSVMIVSRGLGKNNIPRIFNRPELVIINIVPA